MIIFYFIFTVLISKISLSEAGCRKPFILNGNYTIVNYYLKQQIIFRCEKNYTLYGNITNECQGRRWAYPFPVCHKQNNIRPECSAPYIQKGWIECLTVGCNRFYVGTEAAIRCERGYQLIGSSRLHCRWENEPLWTKVAWSSPVPKCVLIDSEYIEINQEPPRSVNIFYSENSSIMIIIIVLSVLACGLMLLISAMLMNRLMRRRRIMRFQRADNSFPNARGAMPTSIDTDDHNVAIATVQNVSSRERNRWNWFSRNGLNYQQMESPATENISPCDQDGALTDNLDLYSQSICSDDRESLINPPCYEEAIKCSQYSIVMPSHSNGKAGKKSKHGISKASKRDKIKHLPIRSTLPPVNSELSCENQADTSSIPNTSIQTTDPTPLNISEANGSLHSAVSPRSSDVDNVSRRSARVHYSRVVNNISAGSNNSFLSGSIETMAVSDGTSVTVHTFDSTGSNPSIGSMRPQTGSIGDPTTFTNQRHNQSRSTAVAGRSNDPDFPAIESGQRYSPPPSYESSINNQVMGKSGRSCRSNTGSPSTSSNMALFVDNMACSTDNEDPHT